MGAVDDFQVGGQDRQLSEVEQLAQLSWYMHEHYPVPEDLADLDAWLARLPDRLTHAAMMMLGSAVDHSMPGVAFTAGVDISDSPAGVVCTPSSPNGCWVLAFGGVDKGAAWDNSWLPEVAALAQLSGATIVDAASADAIDYARAQGATWVAAWGDAAGAQRACQLAPRIDALILTRPIFGELSALPAPARWPRTLIQRGTADVAATRWADAEAHAEVRDYVAEHHVLTPTVARKRLQDAAAFLS